MLTQLIVRNLAIIDQLEVTFGAGFNVLSGETGAGKSILIGALQLLLGGRARTDFIRTGEDEASVQAIFDPMPAGFSERLQQADIPVEEELNIRRTLHRSGKNRIYINGVLVTLAQWQPLGESLVSIYGQHEHQSLLKKENHLALVDHFGETETLLADYQECYRSCRETQLKLDALDANERERQQRIDLLRYQVDEIGSAGLQPGEDEALEQERVVLANAERLREATDGGYQRLYGEGGSTVEKVDETVSALEKLQGISPELDAVSESLRSVQYQLEDAAQQLNQFGSRLEFDPSRQDEVESRLALLQRLQRKYAPDIPSLLSYLADIEDELNDLQHSDENRTKWQEQLRQRQDQMQHAGQALTARRQESAVILQQRVERELSDLGMEKARFEVRFTVTEPVTGGCEIAEFFLAANPGEEARPLVRVASGGELSRIMLAVRRSAPAKGAVATAIFDEVDAGVGGATATAVGQKLKAVAQQSQVLCITHLPQVASFADRHFLIEKTEEEGRTQTHVRSLNAQAQVQEMARLLGGSHMTEQTLAHAREMIERAGRNCA